MKYKISFCDDIELLVTADSEVEAVKKAKEVRSKLDDNTKSEILDFTNSLKDDESADIFAGKMHFYLWSSAGKDVENWIESVEPGKVTLSPETPKEVIYRIVQALGKISKQKRISQGEFRGRIVLLYK